MRRHNLKRDEASLAVISLREAFEMTQQQFAVEVVKTAITTVARWETSNPPRGETLLKLASIATQHGLGKHYKVGEKFIVLRDVFRELYIEEVFSTLGFQMMIAPAKDTKPAHGYLMLKLPSAEQVRAAQTFLLLVGAVDSTDPECKDIARRAFRELRKAASACNKNPILDQIADVFTSDEHLGKAKEKK